jgi:hypothetical protein
MFQVRRKNGRFVFSFDKIRMLCDLYLKCFHICKYFCLLYVRPMISYQYRIVYISKFNSLVYWEGSRGFPFFCFDWLLNCVVFEKTIVASYETNQEEIYMG